MSSQPRDHLHLDIDRVERCGAPEVVFAAGKTVAETVAAATGLVEAHGHVLVTRADADKLAALAARWPDGEACARSGCFLLDPPPITAGPVAVVSAGTSDAGVAEEALHCLRARGVATHRFADCGVAGLHRLLGHIEAIRACVAVVAVAGMDAALPTVLAGLIDIPMVAVPTSVGYGVAAGGQSALHSILASCAPGVTCVNIDNGFGGGYAAGTIAIQLAKAAPGVSGNPPPA